MFRIHDAVTGKLAAFTREDVLYVAPVETGQESDRAVVRLRPAPGRAEHLVMFTNPRKAAGMFRCPVQRDPSALQVLIRD